MQSEMMLVPAAIPLDVERYAAWPFPGMTALETAQSALSMSQEFQEVIAATILSMPGRMGVSNLVQASIPQEWRDALGEFCHASLCERVARQHGIEVDHVPHEGSGGFHIQYKSLEGKA